ncbi:MAG: preprotein translocase subunit SecG [Oceanospirillaceae bacterium]|jgi:preprotein translocase subunit SecG
MKVSFNQREVLCSNSFTLVENRIKKAAQKLAMILTALFFLSRLLLALAMT